jgi:general secretion pathway protein I
MSRAPSDLGFSLIEALVALAVFAMAGVGLVQLQTHSLQTLSQVETRALADIVAQNALVELVAGAVPPAPGQRAEAQTFAGRDWQIVTQVTPAGDMLRVSVAVSSASDATPAARAHAFVAAGVS